MLVKHCLHAFSLLRYNVLRPIECHTITEDKANIGNKFVCTAITRIGRIGVRFGRIRSQ